MIAVFHYQRAWRLAALAAMMAGSLTAADPAADPMPTVQQNALVRKYCTTCHTDAARNGGLSLEHFDATHAAPSLTAMMLSKLTGVPLETVRGIGTNARAAALVHQNMMSGAMRAAAIPIPDPATIGALIDALATASAGATEWSIERTKPAGLTASILREISLRSAKN